MALIDRSADIDAALREKYFLKRMRSQRGILINPYRHGNSGGGGGGGGGAGQVFATWDPSNKGSACVLSNGNLTVTDPEVNGTVRSTMGMSSGKWYWEITSTGLRYPIIGVGLASATLADYPGFGSDSWSYYGTVGTKITGAVQTAYGSTWSSASQVIGVALDLDNHTLEFFKDGVSMGVAFTGLPVGTYYAMTGGDSASTSNCTANFGASSLRYAPPAGFTPGIYTGTSFNPDTDVTSASLAMWIDPSDIRYSSITTGTYNSITCRKTGTVFSQATPANAPTENLTAAPTKQRVMWFGLGANTWVVNATGIAYTVPCHMFIVSAWGNRSATWFGHGIGNATGGNWLSTNPGGTFYWATYADSSSAQKPYLQMQTAVGTGLYTTTFMQPQNSIYVVDGIATGNVTADAIYANSASVPVTRYGTTYTNALAIVKMLGTTDATYHPGGGYGEVLLYNGTLSTADKAAIRAYLKAKWGTP